MFLKTFLFVLLIAQVGRAADYSVFEIRKSLPMENNEAPVKDYYLNVGSESGVKTGMYLSVLRSSTLIDPAKNIAQGTIKIPIAKLHIISVDKKIAVARQVTQTENDERPVVEYEAIMLGDAVDMESATMDAPPKQKRKSASAEDGVTQVIAVVQSRSAEAPPAGSPIVAQVSAIPTVLPQNLPVKAAPPAIANQAPIQVEQASQQQPSAPAPKAPETVKVAIPPEAQNSPQKTENIL